MSENPYQSPRTESVASEEERANLIRRTYRRVLVMVMTLLVSLSTFGFASGLMNFFIRRSFTPRNVVLIVINAIITAAVMALMWMTVQ